MDGGAWWAAVHRVMKSWTRLSDFTFTFHFHVLEKEMATPLQCSCLENPRDGGAWWAAVYGVTVKWLSSSSIESITPRLKFDENHGLWVIMMCWQNFSNHNKHTSLVGGGLLIMGRLRRGMIWEISALYTKCLCGKSKIFLKNKVCVKQSWMLHIQTYWSRLVMWHSLYCNHLQDT